ncbi:MAG: metal-sensing transcriptional repressor [Candidatus Shapirobacteria bacterium]|nr:metal-sensing transcriptional repressor [Candidatus Shapirobacteria bacterium]MDD5073586.1 metal-sensing transcriptional repressor [Candidatus Shapirobacteria bacterium]MDD5481339.1 metal-sensing transcriptional repressor [Candidatus Shapirobacteria bacterium]
MKHNNKDIDKRINYVLGHLEGIKKMIHQNKYCIDIIQQNRAVIAALKKINKIILENHLNTCVTQAIRSKNQQEAYKKIEEILLLFEDSENDR